MNSSIIKISFIIIEYHSIEDVIACYASIMNAFSFPKFFEVIISSNSNYPLAKQKEIISQHTTLKWIFNKKNGGFAYAMNQGLASAEGDVLIIMNPDIRLKFGLEKMLNYLSSHSEIGIIAPKIRNSEGQIQDSFRNFITPTNFLMRHLNRFLKSNNPIEVYKYPNKVDWVIGAFMMMSRQTYNITKGLDERYFLYCEDMDFCKRVHLNGYSVVYYPESEIEYEGTRSARKSWKYACIFMKSLLKYWQKFGLY